MARTNQSMKTPVSEDKIFKIMMTIVFAVAFIFFLKNLITQSWQGAIVIGICLIVFTLTVFIMKKLKLSADKQQSILCIGIVFLVFCISINSGAFYSDDFPLYLAVIAISGLYLVPKIALIQMVLIDILLIIAYVLHPEKADPMSQYMMCVAILTICAYVFYMVIKRGRAYIEIGKERAEEAERLLNELKSTGEELEQNCSHSLERITKLEEANASLEASASELRTGSEDITRDTIEVTETFEDVHLKMQSTESHIDLLNTEVKKVENALSDNRKELQGMTKEMKSLKTTVQSAFDVFSTLQDEILEISKATEQLTKIASSTSMLALNASIEAARAGQMGSGFAVVASKVQELAEDSNACSSQVVNIVNSMQRRIEETTLQLSDSTDAINASISSLDAFHGSFDHLSVQFNSLYDNIEEQNVKVQEMDAIFEELKGKITEMADSSEANKASVSSITDAINVYKDQINLIVSDNMHIHDLSSSMMNLSQK